jgi:hypothetical protein
LQEADPVVDVYVPLAQLLQVAALLCSSRAANTREECGLYLPTPHSEHEVMADDPVE